MRTTLDIDDELLVMVKEIARQQSSTAGEVVSRLLRESLTPAPSRQKYRNGVPLFPRRPGGAQVTADLVNRLRDEDK